MWGLDWNDLTQEERDKLIAAAEFHVCPHCGDPGQVALDLFSEVVGIIKARDERAARATLEGVSG